jgi:DNA-damage-inducible protein D
VDVITALTDSENPAVYWRVLKKRLKDECADQTVTKCNAFKMLAADGRGIERLKILELQWKRQK